MSYDLAVWHSNRAVTIEEVASRYAAFCDRSLESESAAPTSSIDAFVRDLTEKYSASGRCSEDDSGNSPWSSAFDVAGDFAVVSISWSRVAEVVPFLIRLADKHGLICYDPQKESGFWPKRM